MKAFLRFFTTQRHLHAVKLHRFVILITAITLFSGSLNAQTYHWIGSGAGGGNTAAAQDFNNSANWNPNGVPSASNDVVIAFTGSGTINLTALGRINNLTITNNNNNSNCFVNVASFTLTVNGNTSINVIDNHPNNQIHIGVNDAVSKGTVDFLGDVSIGTTVFNDAVLFMGNDSSTIICRKNLTLGARARLKPGAEPGTLLFDGTGTQILTFNNAENSCRFKNIVIGKTNKPTVVVTGISTSFDNILGNLTVNDSAVLNLGTAQLNRQTVGGNLFLKNYAILRLSGSLSLKNGSEASLVLVPGSNFPSGFSNIVLDSTSTVEFYGADQSIPGALHNIKGYGNLTLVNNTKTLISSFAMFRNLTIAANTTMALGNFDDTLKSNNVTTAYVSAVPASAVISYGTSGGFVVERHLAMAKSWRFLATPVQNSTLSITNSWREGGSLTSNGYGTQITGPSAISTGMDQPTQRGSMKWYNKNTNTYVEITNTNDPISRTQGYYVFVRGDRAQNTMGAGSATNLRIKGKILTGDQTFTSPLSVTVSDGYESVGNPYPSKFNYKTALKTNLEPSFTVWNPSAGFYGVGRFIQYVSTGGLYGDYKNGGITLNTIESGQAFFIQSAVSKSGSLTIQESDKSGGSALVSRVETSGREGVNIPTLEVNLMGVNNSTTSALLDQVVINFDNNYSNNFDGNDVRKFMNASDNLSIKIAERNLILESRKNLTSLDTIFLSLSNTRITDYRFNIDPSVLSDLPLKAFLIDKFEQREFPVSLTNVTNANFAITADAASRAANRFMIIFKSVSPAIFTAIKAVRNNDNSVAITWNMRNENNINTYSIERSIDAGITFTTINSQIPTANNFGSPYYTVVDAAAPKEQILYRIKANTISNGSFYSDNATGAKAADDNKKHGISIYPNPVVNGTVNLYFNNQIAGKYTVSIVNSKGEQVKLAAVNINNNAVAETINIDETAAGMYSAVITNADGKNVVIPFVKQ